MARPIPQNSTSRKTSRPPLPPLENGERLDQKTFHERYEAMPANARAELIGGIVYMASPVGRKHGRNDTLTIWWLGEYQWATENVEVLTNSTSILGDKSEPQADVSVRIVEGGNTRVVEGDYIEGAPEMMVETAVSTGSIDLHAKKDDYEKA